MPPRPSQSQIQMQRSQQYNRNMLPQNATQPEMQTQPQMQVTT